MQNEPWHVDGSMMISAYMCSLRSPAIHSKHHLKPMIGHESFQVVHIESLGLLGRVSSCSDTDGSLIPGRNQETYLCTDTRSTPHVLFGKGNLHLFESI